MSHRYSCKVIIRDDYVKRDGRSALALQIFINGSRKVIPIGAHVQPQEFNRDKERVSISDAETSALINALIHKMKSRSEKIFYKAILDDRILTCQAFEESLLNKSGDTDWYVFMAMEIAKEKMIRARGTINNYEKCLNRLKEFKKSLALTEINLEFVRGFDRFMRSVKKYEPNTVAKYHQTFLKFINIAKKQKRRITDPYIDFKINSSLSEEMAAKKAQV